MTTDCPTGSDCMGTRCKRFSMRVDDGTVKALHIEEPGSFKVSDAATMLQEL